MGEIEGAEVHQEIVFHHGLPSGGIGTAVKGLGDNMVSPKHMNIYTLVNRCYFNET